MIRKINRLRQEFDKFSAETTFKLEDLNAKVFKLECPHKETKLIITWGKVGYGKEKCIQCDKVIRLFMDREEFYEEKLKRLNIEVNECMRILKK